MEARRAKYMRKKNVVLRDESSYWTPLNCHFHIYFINFLDTFKKYTMSTAEILVLRAVRSSISEQRPHELEKFLENSVFGGPKPMWGNVEFSPNQLFCRLTYQFQYPIIVPTPTLASFIMNEGLKLDVLLNFHGFIDPFECAPETLYWGGHKWSLFSRHPTWA